VRRTARNSSFTKTRVLPNPLLAQSLHASPTKFVMVGTMYAGARVGENAPLVMIATEESLMNSPVHVLRCRSLTSLALFPATFSLLLGCSSSGGNGTSGNGGPPSSPTDSSTASNSEGGTSSTNPNDAGRGEAADASTVDVAEAGPNVGSFDSGSSGDAGGNQADGASGDGSSSASAACNPFADTGCPSGESCMVTFTPDVSDLPMSEGPGTVACAPTVLDGGTSTQGLCPCEVGYVCGGFLCAKLCNPQDGSENNPACVNQSGEPDCVPIETSISVGVCDAFISTM
jgi:hypothetical protein